MLLVVLLKNVLLLQIPEQHHHFIQNNLNVLLAHAPDSFAQSIIHEQADVLSTSVAEVDEVLERQIDHILESLVIVQGLGDDPANTATTVRLVEHFRMCSCLQVNASLRNDMMYSRGRSSFLFQAMLAVKAWNTNEKEAPGPWHSCIVQSILRQLLREVDAPVILFPFIEQSLHIFNRVLQAFGICDELPASCPEMVRHDLPYEIQAPIHSFEDIVHSPQILVLVMDKQGNEARVVHLHEGPHLTCPPLPISLAVTKNVQEADMQTPIAVIKRVKHPYAVGRPAGMLVMEQRANTEFSRSSPKLRASLCSLDTGAVIGVALCGAPHRYCFNNSVSLKEEVTDKRTPCT